MASVVISGDTSGAATISAPAVAGTPTLTLPTTTDTLVGKATTDTLTNKTLTSPTIATPTMTGQATIPTINLTGGQITFPATQSPSSDANTLDDYEEGTWNPSVGGNATYTARSGSYTKVGRMVTCSFDLTINAIGTGSTTSINNFPFVNGTTSAIAGYISYYVSIATATNFISIYLNGTDTSTNCSGNTASATTIGLNGFAVFGNSTRLIGSITYPTST